MDEINDLFEKWKSQVRKGYLELCVLGLIEANSEMYGFDIMDTLNALGVDVSEGTLYPLLGRMVRERSMDADWKTEGLGHPRKYYRLSGEGRALLGMMAEEYGKNYQSYLATRSRRESE
jgi:PadR family transcriptional regulator, regulatory protein PadR